MTHRVISSGRRSPDVTLRAAPSKSATHRALVAAALATGTSRIVTPLDADDTRVTRDGLRALGVPIEDGDDAWVVRGVAGRIAGGGRIALGESGTSMRFLAAVAALGDRPSVLDGAERLRARPLDELVPALGESLQLSPSGGLPARAGGGVAGGRVALRADRSSQFASALLLIAPRLPQGIDLELVGDVVSRPYLELTVRMLAAFGVETVRDGGRLRIAPQSYAGRELIVEGDHSSASYFLAIPPILGGTVRIDGLDAGSVQADAVFPKILEQLGCRVTAAADRIEVTGTGSLPGFDLDMRDAPDLVPTLATLALFADGPSVVRGVAHLAHKESDRAAVLAENLGRLGRTARAVEDRLEIGPPAANLRPAVVRTASDHRMAMAFAVAGLRLPGLTIDDAPCVAKSHPDFWKELARFEAGQN